MPLHLKKPELRPGLTAAADYLLGQALEYDGMAKRHQTFLDREIRDHGARVVGVEARRREIADYYSKAQLLRDHAGYVLELQK